MCRTLADYVFVATQTQDANMHTGMLFRKGIGFLMLPPKRVPKGKVLNDAEWMRMHYYPKDEEMSMTAALSDLGSRLLEWSSAMQGNEDSSLTGEADVPFARFIWDLHKNVFKGRFSVFKNVLGATEFRPALFLAMGEHMPQPPIRPSEDEEYVAQTKDDDYDEEMMNLHRRIANGIELMASEAVSDGQARRRVGSDGEIRQENEIVNRYRANGERGLRGFVAQVLREPNWQFADGHTNTDEGRARCYNRAYALIHPFRRHDH